MNRKTLLFAIVIVALVCLAIASYFVYAGGSGSGAIPADGGGTLKVEVKPGDHTLGNPKAPVTMVEYAAPTCPHCAHFDEEVFPKLKANYIDTGKVFYIFRVFPLSAVDVAVEGMARCLPKDSYFQFMDMMFRNQQKWDPDGYQIPDVHAALINMGRIAGMSEQKVDACISDQQQQKDIQDIGTHANKAYGINGTPSFIIDGQMAPYTVVTWQGMQDALNAALKRKTGK